MSVKNNYHPMSKTALIITTYNRPELLAKCLDSLRQCDLSKVDHLIFVDDCSSDTRVADLIGDFRHPFVSIAISDKNVGIKQSLLSGYDIAFHSCDYAINLDPDAIVKPNFINELLHLKEQQPEFIISGFNCNHPANPVISSHDGYVLRKHCNGINMLIDKDQYEAIIKPALLSKGNWDFNSTHKLPFVISKPSLVQHIGANDSTMGHNKGDVACDFKLLSLPSVCLFGIDAHDPQGLIRAADICRRDVEFGAEKIITEHEYFRGREGYSKFMIRDLWQHVKDNNCSHVLTIHGDGFIQNPLAWDNDWLKIDYLGATWVYKDGMNVGNGGFSLRSKKLIEICSRLDISDFHPEDCKIARKYRPFLEKEFGIAYGTEEQANRFSIEAYGCNFMQDSSGVRATQYTGQFGSHGYGIMGLPHLPAPRNTPLNKFSRPARRVR